MYAMQMRVHTINAFGKIPTRKLSYLQAIHAPTHEHTPLLIDRMLLK
jgi:hypothetical protein